MTVTPCFASFGDGIHIRVLGYCLTMKQGEKKGFSREKPTSQPVASERLLILISGVFPIKPTSPFLTLRFTRWTFALFSAAAAAPWSPSPPPPPCPAGDWRTHLEPKSQRVAAATNSVPVAAAATVLDSFIPLGSLDQVGGSAH